jgi:hypothetical protein
MLFLIVFLFSFERIVCSDRITIQNLVKDSSEIVFLDQSHNNTAYLIGYVDNEKYKPFDKNKKIKVSVEDIIKVTEPRGIMLQFKDDKPYFCPYFDSIEEIIWFFENTNLDEVTKNIILEMLCATNTVQKELFKNEKRLWNEQIVFALSTFITNISDSEKYKINEHIVQDPLKELLSNFNEHCKKIVDEASSNQLILPFDNGLTPYFDIGMTIFLIAFLYLSYHNKEILQSLKNPRSPRLAVMAYVAFMSIELKNYLTGSSSDKKDFSTSPLGRAYSEYTKIYNDLLRNEYFKSKSLTEPSKDPFLDNYKNIPELEESLSTGSVDKKDDELD